MSERLRAGSLSVRQQVLFWWILFVCLQSTERLFLLKDAAAREWPSAELLFKTVLVGLRGDFIVATIALVLAALVAVLIAGLRVSLAARHEPGRTFRPAFQRGLRAGGLLVSGILLVLLYVDMGYYAHNQQHLDFVFLEYLGDLFIAPTVAGATAQQASQQTGAEVGDWEKWGSRVAFFTLLEACAIAAWWGLFRNGLRPALVRRRPTSPLRTNALFGLCLLAGATGFHHQGPYGIRIADIGSTVYYTLAQNPVLFASEALRISLVSRDGTNRDRIAQALAPDEALRVTRELVAPGALFPDARFPLIKQAANQTPGVQFDRPVNILLIFIEGLDRRFLGRTYGDTPGTPFLDRLKADSLYFEHFFANGVQTSRGLFASFCSYYPRHGAAAMKTRYAHDYACLPSWLQRHGYRTEMVIGQHRDLNRLQTFMARNGLHSLYSESEFAPDAERSGLGISDGALFGLLRQRIEMLQASPQPFMLATLTLATHHPFGAVPDHPDVSSLLQLPDPYIAALRYTDLHLERLFTALRRDGLLRNTIVFILGDHGRHEAVGETEFERQVGHFASPLFIWFDESVRSDSRYRPRTISAVASQVDLLPTILALNGIAQPLGPSLGRDLSCLFVRDCLEDNFAFLSSMYDDAIGMASAQGVLLYSLRTERLTDADLDFTVRAEGVPPSDPSMGPRLRNLLALYQTANGLLDQNRIWSWREYGHRL